MITIYCDTSCTQQTGFDLNVWCVQAISEYIPLRQRLRRALSDWEHDFTVYVRDRMVLTWLDDMRDYDSTLVKWVQLSPREQFRDEYGFPPPVDLEETAVVQLLELSLVRENWAADDPCGWILSQVLGPVWQPAVLHKRHFAELAAWAATNGDVPVMLTRLVQSRLVQWEAQDSRYGLFREQTLRSAGQMVLLRSWLDRYPTTCSLRQQLEKVPIEDCSQYVDAARSVLGQHTADLKHFWTMWLSISAPEDMPAAVRKMTGVLDAELDTFNEWAKRNPNLLTTALLDQVRLLFKPLARSQALLRRLEQSVPPPMPTTPEENWPVGEWLQWATSEYMPYFAWVIRNNQDRGQQMHLAGRFAAWLASQYGNLVFVKDTPLIIRHRQAIQNWTEANPDSVVFWFIIDGLTWWQAGRLVDICSDQELGIETFEPALSALPSVTCVSKKVLALGYLDPQIEKESVASLLVKQLTALGHTTTIVSQPEQLGQYIADGLKPGIYVLLYNALDAHNHDSRGFTDDQSVAGYLDLLVHYMQEGLDQAQNQGMKAAVFVSSDHGSTLLPPQPKVLPVPRFAQALNDPEDVDEEPQTKTKKTAYGRTRTCSVPALPEGDAAAVLEDDWHILRRADLTLSEDFLIPKGYQAVGQKPRGWTHGGATPEETVVAFIQLQHAPSQLVEPVIRFTGQLGTRTNSSLQFEIVNPNSVPLCEVRLALPGWAHTLQWSKVKPQSTSSKVAVTAPPATSSALTQKIEWVLSFQDRGHSYQFAGVIGVPIRRLQVSAVDDLFGEMK
jgi:hypothetical protein